MLGPRALSFISLLTSKYRLSKRLVLNLFKDLFNFKISIESISNSEHTVSKSLQIIHEEAHDILKQQPIVNADETGHKENYKKSWMWVGATKFLTVFLIRPSRGKKITKELFGEFLQ